MGPFSQSKKQKVYQRNTNKTGKYEVIMKVNTGKCKDIAIAKDAFERDLQSRENGRKYSAIAI